MFHPENWRAATEALWSNKLRAFLTTLGVVIGSASIVLVITVAVSGSRYIISQIEGVGANLVYGGLVVSGVKTITRSDEITLSDLHAIQQEIPQIEAIAGIHDMAMTIDLRETARPITLIGVTEGYAQVRNLVIMQGRYFDHDDMRTRAKECVITPHLAHLAYPNQDPIGRPLRLGELKFTIIGVFRERVSTFGQSEIQRNTALVPFPVIQMFSGNQFVSTFYASCDSPQAVPLVTREIDRVLRSRHRPGAEYQVQNLASILEAARKISRALMVVLLLTAGIALLISGIGIMNIMLVTVTERTHEIGIRKAVGARKQEIMNQFLLEALIISLTGAVVGVAIAIAVATLARQLLPPEIHVPVPWISVVLAFAVSCTTGLLFGYLPANKAAKLQPTESLRYE